MCGLNPPNVLSPGNALARRQLCLRKIHRNVTRLHTPVTDASGSSNSHSCLPCCSTQIDIGAHS